MSSQWMKNDELFVAELKQGYAWQSLPVAYFQAHGLKVDQPSLSIREDVKDAPKWDNTTDLYVNGYKIEVKSRRETFTNAKDYPYATAFVDTVKGYDLKDPKPEAYILISRTTGAMLCLSGTKTDDWEVLEKFDRVRRIKERFYAVPKKKLVALDSLLKYLSKPA